MAERPVVLAIDFGGTKIAAAIADADGTRIESTTIRIDPADSAQTSFERGIALARSLHERLAGDRELRAVGACTFGIPHETHIDLAPNIEGWESIAFGHDLRAAFAGAAVEIGTDVKAAAQAEAEWGALADCNPGIYLNLGTGLAAAIVVDGIVLAGHHGAAGEIGYNLRHPADVGALERWMLEERVSGKALRQRALPLLMAPPSPEHDDEVDEAAALFHAAQHDPAAASLIDDFVTELSLHLVNLSIAIDPARVAVGGGMVRSWQHLEGPMRAALDAAMPFPPQLVRADFPYEASLLGATALAVRAGSQVALA